MTEAIRPPALILAGGSSRRMGTDKAALQLAGTPLALCIAERLRPQASKVYLNAPSGHLLGQSLPLVPDTRPDRPGPLAGILAGLKLFAEQPNGPPHIVTTPCDTPFLPNDLVMRLCETAASGTIVLAASNSRTHPITALWPIALADDLEDWLDHPDHRRVFDFVARHPSQKVEFPTFAGPSGPVDPFFNINTPQDVAIAEDILRQGAA
ncbi:MAG: molybdenum cofactor guanylyltransferase [Rhizobium sp.]|nr:molybdenum cofactor guanylyltransferase [Rhizobium sp.]MCZ8350060.1 molybdenum cofactor guanylyltransferase [Rhizobium sp.]